MIKISVSTKTVENFKAQVLSNFYDITNKKIGFKKKKIKK